MTHGHFLCLSSVGTYSLPLLLFTVHAKKQILVKGQRISGKKILVVMNRQTIGNARIEFPNSRLFTNISSCDVPLNDLINGHFFNFS